MSKRNDTTLTDLINLCPGVVGDIARYVYSASEIDQPGIALASAFALVSAVQSEKIGTVQGHTPCMYTAVVATSGAGKSTAQRLITELITDADIGGIIMGKPASDVGLLNALAEGQENTRRLIIWDEFGPSLSAFSNSKNSYEGLILSTMMDVFSASGGSYTGKEYAPNQNGKKRERVDIEEVYLSIFAASTPSRFFGALSKDMILDGFLTRWMLFFGEPKIKFKAPWKRDKTEIVASLTKMAINTKASGNIGYVMTVKKMVKFHEDCQVAKWKKQTQVNTTSAKYGSFEEAFWIRSFEHTMKISLCLADYDDYTSTWTVSPQAFEFACTLVDFLIYQTLEECGKFIFDSVVQKKDSDTRKRFINLFKVGEYISRSTLTDKTGDWGIKRKEREEIVADLVDSGIWDPQHHDVNNSGRKSEVFVRLK